MLYLCSRARDHAAARRTQYNRRIEQPATVAWSRCRAPGYSCSLCRREYLLAVAAIALGTGPWRSRLSSRWCSWAGWPLERELARFGSRLSICPIVVSIGSASNTKIGFIYLYYFHIVYRIYSYQVVNGRLFEEITRRLQFNIVCYWKKKN